MDDSSELVASLIALAGEGSHVAIKLSEFGSMVDWAFAAELGLLSQSLSAISKGIERKTGKEEQVKELARKVVEASRSLLGDLQKVIKELDRTRASDLTPPAPGWAGSLLWLDEAPLRSPIDALRYCSALLVASSDAAEACYREAPEKIL